MTGSRLPGLDTLRAVAIILVFMTHYQGFVTEGAPFGMAGDLGWAGVDLFFVLSGYLIGNQLLSGVAAGQRLSLGGFYSRRALRTLPNYLVILACYFLFPAFMGGTTPQPLWRFLTFTQNFGLQTGTAFSHAWSLCVEEQFYLVMPLLALAFVIFGKRRWMAWTALAAMVALATSARYLGWRELHPNGSGWFKAFYALVYYNSLCRFDEFLPGIALALLRNFHPLLWTRIEHHGNKVLAGGLLLVIGSAALHQHGFFIKDYGFGFFATVFGYPLLAISFGLLTASALCPNSLLGRFRIPGTHSIALWSFAIYLSHKPIMMILRREWLDSWTAGDSPFVIAVIAGACVVGGCLLHYFVERPFLALRRHICPDIFIVPKTNDDSVPLIPLTETTG